MEVFTCTLSLISGNELTYETIDDSMLTAATRTFAPCGRTPQTMLDYAIKDGDVVAGGLNPRLDISTATSDTVWHRIANAETVDEFWSTVRAGTKSASVQPSVPSERTRTGIIDPSLLSTKHPPGLQLRTDHMPELDEWST